MVTEGKEAFSLAEILYCCLSLDKRLLIRRSDKHSDTIESDNAPVGEGGCFCASLHTHANRCSVDGCGLAYVCVNAPFVLFSAGANRQTWKVFRTAS